MHNLKPKKHLGQHFLTDINLATRIVRLLAASEAETVVEIGPGKGILTQFLTPKFPNLVLIEVDPDAVAYLANQFPDPSFRILQTDVLKWDLSADIPENACFIGNLPYNISSPIFFLLLENLRFIREGVFMIQKEVADRIVADPGSKTYGILSVLTDAYFEVKKELNVPPDVFSPPPKVMSAVIRMQRRDSFPDVRFSDLKRVVKTAFNQRRKTLRNALKSLVFKDFPEKTDFFSRRAETLSTSEFVLLTKNLEG
jgi:16S rRNA (adenine1518-N6/adenine1519-N6)-dimethyltransferase